MTATGPDPGAAGAVGTAAPLDEVMLAMDVVDTLRHRQQLVEQEIAGPDRDEDMLERLRRIYQGQGIDVPEHVLRDGVAALREDRFSYRPPPPSTARTWAMLYVQRGRWGRRLLVVAVVAALVVVAYRGTVVAPREAVVRGLDDEGTAIVALARAPAVVERAATLDGQGRAALASGDLAEARTTLDAMRELRRRLEQVYDLRIVTGADETSGIWRVPDANSRARNYYLIVEAVDAAGRRLTLPIHNEETGRTESVSTWGLRVDEATWQAVAADLESDGVLQERQVGRKTAGELDPAYSVATTGGTITRW